MPLYAITKDDKGKFRADLIKHTELTKKSYFERLASNKTFCVFLERPLTKTGKNVENDFDITEKARAYAHLQNETIKAIKANAENKSRELEYLQEYNKSILPIIKKLCGAI